MTDSPENRRTNQITIGKFRGLQRCATPGGALAVLALDHRNNLRNALRPDAPTEVTLGEMVAFKREVTAALAPAASAVLLDPEVGAAQCIAASAIPASCGLVVAVEETGYSGEPVARKSRVLPGWSVAQARRMGADAVKLLVYYHPESPTAREVEGLVVQLAEDCARSDIPLFLEPLSYSLDPARKKLPPGERRQVVIETARRLVVPGVDVLKAEFPLDVAAEPDESTWRGACAELSSACPVPWVLLSASVTYEIYLRQVAVACAAGASGVAVGRAVWQEAPGLARQARRDFLAGPARRRLQRITSLCDALARPWTEFFTCPEPGAGWYEQYS